MMREVVMAVRNRVGEDGVRAQPLADRIVPPFRPRQHAMGAIVHQNGEPELPASDQQHRRNEREGVRPQRIQRHRGADHDPGMRDTEQPRYIRPRTDGRHFLWREHLGRIEARDAHDNIIARPCPISKSLQM